MSKMRVLCTADLHLGRSSAVPHFASDVDLTTTGAWRRIVDMAILEDADAVVVAGDLFDGAGSYLEARKSFVDGIRLLGLKGIPVVAVAGNHDWNVLPLVARETPENFHLLGKGAVWERKRIATPNGDLSFVGWSFASEHVNSSQFGSLEARVEDCPVLGLIHGDSSPGSVYHPIAESDLRGKADCWIVGHVHKSGWIGDHALYPGSPQALDFGHGERGGHGVRWLEIQSGIPTFSEIVPVSTAWFEMLEIDLALEQDKSGWDTAIDHLQKRCLEICQELSTTETVHIRAKVTLRGDSEERLPTDGGVLSYLDRHSLEIVSIRFLKPIDPWSLKDLRDHTGEAARLLIGAQALLEEEIRGPEIPINWIEDARKLVELSSKDIEFQFQRTLATVSDQGESAVHALSEDEVFETAHAMLVDELWKTLQEAVN